MKHIRLLWQPDNTSVDAIYKNPIKGQSQSQSHITADSPGVRHPSGTHDQFFFRQLRVCYFVAPSLTRGRAYYLLLKTVYNRIYIACERRSIHTGCLQKSQKRKGTTRKT
jgi:hypothetical protein